MSRYLITIHRPRDYDPATEDAAMKREIDALNEAMVAAGVRVFVGGLKSPATARALRRDAAGTVHISAGLYLNSEEHVGGLWVLDVGTDEEAVEWGRKAALACRASVEVRPFH